MPSKPTKTTKSNVAAQSTTIQDAATGVVAFLKTIRKHWPIVVASVVIALTLAVVYTKSQKPLYQAIAMVEFDPNAIRPLNDSQQSGGGGFMTYWDNKEYYETQYKIITSNNVLTRVVRDLNLNEEAAAGRKASPASLEDSADALRGEVTVEPVKNSRLILVKVKDTNAARARRICDAIVSTYLAQNMEKTVHATADAVVWLSGQVDHYKGEVEANENELNDFKVKNELPSASLNEASNMLRLEMQSYNDSLSKTRTRKQELLARHAELSKVSSDDPDVLPASELLASSFLATVRSQYQVAVKDKKTLMAEGKGENHPLVLSANQRMAEARSALLNEVRNIQGAVARDLAIVQREEAGESGLFEASRRRAVDLNMKEIEYHRLDRSREQNEKLYAMLLERMKQADLARMMNVNNVRLVDAPTEPRSPISPVLSKNVAVGFILGLLFGIAAAWTRESLDSSIKTPDDVEQKLGVTFLGLLPAIEGDAEVKKAKSRRRRFSTADAQGPPELIVHERPLSGVAEAARSVRTNLLFMNPDKPYRKILVSSAAPSEGKTTVACSIAIALAQGGERVCIVDCDLRRPRLHRIFHRAGDMGVTNVLVGEATVDEVAKSTMVENLWSIPTGPTPPNPADLLHSDRFKRFLNELGEKFDRVIIDSPPLVAVTDASILSTLVDGVVYVLRAFKTTKELSRQGLRSLFDVDATVIGAVLNAVNLNRLEYSYYHYYYYKRDGYRANPQAKPGDGDGDEYSPGAPPPN
jgi:succinoglycan biosynthesis transport protein ExoP